MILMFRNSTPFVNALKRIRELQDRYLPGHPTALGDYSQAEQDNARACTLLVHAEVEYYLEELARLLASEALARASNDEFDLLTSALLYNADSRSSELAASSAEDAIKGTVGLHGKIIAGNNGMKASDVSKLFKPFYFGDMNLDSELTAALDTFGTRRGEHAHVGAMGITKQVNAYEVRQDIDALCVLLESFDKGVMNRFAIAGG